MIFFVGFVRVSYFFLSRGKEAAGLIPVNNNNVKKIITSFIQPVNGKVPPGSCVKVGLGGVAPSDLCYVGFYGCAPTRLAAVGLAHHKERIILHKNQSRDAKISKINEKQK